MRSNIEDFREDEFTELTGVGDCYGDEIRIFFAFHPELTFDDVPEPGYIFIADPRFINGELGDWGYCLRVKGNKLVDIFTRMQEAVTVKEKVGWAPLNPDMLDHYTNAQLASLPDRFRVINGKWHYKVVIDSAGRQSEKA